MSEFTSFPLKQSNNVRGLEKFGPTGQSGGRGVKSGKMRPFERGKEGWGGRSARRARTGLPASRPLLSRAAGLQGLGALGLESLLEECRGQRKAIRLQEEWGRSAPEPGHQAPPLWGARGPLDTVGALETGPVTGLFPSLVTSQKAAGPAPS